MCSKPSLIRFLANKRFHHLTYKVLNSQFFRERLFEVVYLDEWNSLCPITFFVLDIVACFKLRKLNEVQILPQQFVMRLQAEFCLFDADR